MRINLDPGTDMIIELPEGYSLIAQVGPLGELAVASFYKNGKQLTSAAIDIITSNSSEQFNPVKVSNE